MPISLMPQEAAPQVRAKAVSLARGSLAAQPLQDSPLHERDGTPTHRAMGHAFSISGRAPDGTDLEGCDLRYTLVEIAEHLEDFARIEGIRPGGATLATGAWYDERGTVTVDLPSGPSEQRRPSGTTLAVGHCSDDRDSVSLDRASNIVVRKIAALMRIAAAWARRLAAIRTSSALFGLTFARKEARSVATDIVATLRAQSWVIVPISLQYGREKAHAALIEARRCDDGRYEITAYNLDTVGCGVPLGQRGGRLATCFFCDQISERDVFDEERWSDLLQLTFIVGPFVDARVIAWVKSFGQVSVPDERNGSHQSVGTCTWKSPMLLLANRLPSKRCLAFKALVRAKMLRSYAAKHGVVDVTEQPSTSRTRGGRTQQTETTIAQHAWRQLMKTRSRALGLRPPGDRGWHLGERFLTLTHVPGPGIPTVGSFATLAAVTAAAVALSLPLGELMVNVARS